MPTGLELVGRHIRKVFEGIAGEFEGIIESYDEASGYYHVFYEADGDREDLEEADLEAVTLLPVTASRQRPKGRQSKAAPAPNDRPTVRADSAGPSGTAGGRGAARGAVAAAGKRPARGAAAGARSGGRRPAIDDSDDEVMELDEEEEEEDAPASARRPRRASTRGYAEHPEVSDVDGDTGESTEESDDSGREDDGETEGSEGAESGSEEDEEAQQPAGPARCTPRTLALVAKRTAAEAGGGGDGAGAAASKPAAKRVKKSQPPALLASEDSEGEGGEDMQLDGDEADAADAEAPKAPRLTAAQKGKSPAQPAAKQKVPKSRASPAPTPFGKGKDAKEMPMEWRDGDTECCFGNVDESLWDLDGKQPKIKPPSPLPTTLNILETFAGCGGFHMQGSATLGGRTVTLNTVAAVEIEGDPANTYKFNYASVNVLQLGVGRFLGTARRLLALKTMDMETLEPLPPPPAGSTAAEPDLVVTEMFLDVGVSSRHVQGQFYKPPSQSAKPKKGAEDAKTKNKSTTQRQDMDYMSIPASQGRRALFWLKFRVVEKGKAREVTDCDTPALRMAVHKYLNSAAFTAKVFPLPGDIQVITGGPPCQGWSGYNTTRITAAVLAELMLHPENRLLGRFLEIVWFYKPIFVVMEEVPAVADKAGVMNWMESQLERKGYRSSWDKKIVTGLYGCPQTRDRLLVIASLEDVQQLRMPQPITHGSEVEQLAVQWAFDEDDPRKLAFPLTVKCRTDGSAAKAEAARRAAADAKMLELNKKGCFGPLSGEGAAAVEKSFAELQTELGPRAAKKHKSAKAASSPLPSTSKPLLRALVLGDSLSCDLPAEAKEVPGEKDISGAEDARDTYLTPPPTSYIAYLRRGMPANGQVTGHAVFKLGPSDRMRIDAVPFRPDASWRDMFGHLGTLHAPQMFTLTDDEWRDIGSRQRNKIPSYMRKERKPEDGEKEAAGKGMPELVHGWELAPKRWAVVPFWCLTMKHGNDKSCYGRLGPTEPHLTIHSYNKPHWHASLAPFANRVLSVRDKARVQGFPDKFCFRGAIHSQYKQIANAVSPQLAIGVGRELLTALLGTLSAQEAATEVEADPVFSESLQNFADFLTTFDESSIPPMTRLLPIPPAVRPVSPMTYEEILVEYNTIDREDHSIRYDHKTPYQILVNAERQHPWHAEEMVGFRLSPSGSGFELAMRYPGFPDPEWVAENISEYKNVWAYRKFEDLYGLAMAAVRSRRKPYFVLSGVQPDGVSTQHPVIAAAEARFDEMEKRYSDEKLKGWVKKGAKSAARKGNHKQAAEAEDGDEAEEGEDGKDND